MKSFERIIKRRGNSRIYKDFERPVTISGKMKGKHTEIVKI